MVRALALSALLALAACQTTAKGSFCAISHPIRLSQKTIDAMTDREVAQVLAFNTKGQKLCGWKP